MRFEYDHLGRWSALGSVRVSKFREPCVPPDQKVGDRVLHIPERICRMTTGAWLPGGDYLVDLTPPQLVGGVSQDLGVLPLGFPKITLDFDELVHWLDFSLNSLQENWAEIQGVTDRNDVSSRSTSLLIYPFYRRAAWHTNGRFLHAHNQKHVCERRTVEQCYLS